ncbi:unnamed protein product [Sphagnum jensenii]|uniref:Uncharacterized protein n=2 Tax=Sphagnum jensenii TaxID=128206 RepID=A0ABP1B0Q6_9BRYO
MYIDVVFHLQYKYANFSSLDYVHGGVGSVTFQLVKQRQDFSFGLFSGDILNPVLEAVSNTVTFSNLKAPVFLQLATGSTWDGITVTWTSGCAKEAAVPLVKWGSDNENNSYFPPAITLSYSRKDMCGAPARTVGWRDPGYFHTAYLKHLWPRTRYRYMVGHKLKSGEHVWGKKGFFTSAPSPGEESLQCVIIFGDMGKNERDGLNEYNQYQHGVLNTTDQLVKDVANYEVIFHVGDLSYANGYISEWDQFTEQVGTIASNVLYMFANGNQEQDFLGTGSFFQNLDSGGECGVPAQTIYNMPTKNKAKYWYGMEWGMFHFCVADSEMDWREGSEQCIFLEECLASVDRQRQPWLIFIAHCVLG